MQEKFDKIEADEIIPSKSQLSQLNQLLSQFTKEITINYNKKVKQANGDIVLINKLKKQ